jgi:hypothetical protein
MRLYAHLRRPWLTWQCLLKYATSPNQPDPLQYRHLLSVCRTGANTLVYLSR